MSIRSSCMFADAGLREAYALVKNVRRNLPSDSDNWTKLQAALCHIDSAIRELDVNPKFDPTEL